MVAKTGGVVVVPIVKQALSWIHCAFFATLLALNFSLVGTCKLFTIVHRGHSVLRARQLSWEEWSVVSCFELSPHYCGGSAQAVHRQCSDSALRAWQSGVLGAAQTWRAAGVSLPADFCTAIPTAIPRLQYPLQYALHFEEEKKHYIWCLLLYALQYKYLLHYPLQYALHKTRVHTALSTILIPVVHCNALWVLQKYTVM